MSSPSSTSRLASPRGVLARARAADRILWLQLLAVVPAVTMLQLILDSSQLPWLDYWQSLVKYTEPDGDLIPRNLAHFHEGHVPALPSLVFWINLHLTGGRSHPIGFYVIAVAVAQVLALRFLLPRPAKLGAWWHTLLVLAAAILVFAPQGAWNYARSVSGASWLTANLLTIVAIALAARGRVLLSIAPAWLASLTYGTGLVAWPAIVLVALVRLGRRDWRVWAVAAAGVITIGTYAAFYEKPASQNAAGMTINDVGRRLFQVLGNVLSPNAEIALVIGAVGVGLACYLATVVLRSAELRRDALPFVALTLYGFLTALLIGGARGGTHDQDLGVVSRYTSLSAMFWIGILALAVIAFRPDRRLWLLVFAVGALAFTSGQPTLESMRITQESQDELAIAMRMGASEGYPYAPNPKNTAIFQSLGHYPFNKHWKADCGMFGKRLDARLVVPPSDGTAGQLDGPQEQKNPNTVRLGGWFDTRDGETRCILFTDGGLRVIGAGVPDTERGDLVGRTPTGDVESGFIGPAWPARTHRAFAVVEGRSGFYEVPGPARPSE